MTTKPTITFKSYTSDAVKLTALVETQYGNRRAVVMKHDQNWYASLGSSPGPGKHTFSSIGHYYETRIQAMDAVLRSTGNHGATLRFTIPS